MDDTINVLLLVDFSDALIDRFKLVSPRLKFTRKQARTANDIPRDVWATTDILYSSRVLPDPEISPRLRWIQLHSAGVDQVIDHAMLHTDGVAVTSTSGIHASTIAEFSFAMILAFARRIPQMLRKQEKAEWSEDRYNLFMPRELRRSTLGIVGYGSIGRAIARLGQAFGMEVLASKRNVMQPASVNEYEEAGVGDPEGQAVDRLYPPEALRSMAALSDFLVVTLPLTPATRGVVNAEVLAAMKKTAVLVNIGRGAVVDEDALIKALQSGQIAGAGLDVFTQEPLPASSPLWGMSNVIISPHISGNTDRYNEAAAEVFTQNLERFLDRKELLNRVDSQRGY